jgi:hypothetical protein
MSQEGIVQPGLTIMTTRGAGSARPDPGRQARPNAQEVTVTVTEAPNPRPVDGCVVQPWRV